jgi:hypothetical protein
MRIASPRRAAPASGTKDASPQAAVRQIKAAKIPNVISVQYVASPATVVKNPGMKPIRMPASKEIWVEVKGRDGSPAVGATRQAVAKLHLNLPSDVAVKVMSQEEMSD